MLHLELEFDGRVFVPDQPVNLPQGYRVSLTVRDEPGQPPAGRSLLGLARIADEIPSDPLSPVDRSIQHDHYLYGLPKKP